MKIIENQELFDKKQEEFTSELIDIIKRTLEGQGLDSIITSPVGSYIHGISEGFVNTVFE